MFDTQYRIKEGRARPVQMEETDRPNLIPITNQAFQAARTQLEQHIHNNVDSKEKLAMLSLVKDMAAAMEAEQDIADGALRIGYAKRRTPLARMQDFILGEVRAA